MRKNICNIIKSIAFVTLGILIFIYIQNFFIPKWNYPKFADDVSDSLKTFFSQDKQMDDVIFVGTSHSLCSVSPMYIYEQNGIVSYNLSTSAQSVDITYYLLEEAFKTQSPQLIVFDVSGLFFTEEDRYDAKYRYVIDNISFGANKLKFAKEYAEIDGIEKKEVVQRYLSVIFPIYQYHTRWSELSFNDFNDDDNYSMAGYHIVTYFQKGDASIEDMNETAEAMYEDSDVFKIEIKNNNVNEEHKESRLYKTEISDENIEYLNAIRELCKKNNADILLVKYPTIKYPNLYSSAWTSIRSEYMHKFASENGYQFLDLLYDADIGIDVNSDFFDGGAHMNYLGAKKVSSYIGDYLADEYGIQSKVNMVYDSNMAEYKELTKLAELQLEQDFEKYLEKLNSNKENYIICIATRDWFQGALTDNEIEMMYGLGLHPDLYLEKDYGNLSYISVIDSGDVRYEAVSSRLLEYGYAEGDISITSSGWLSYPEASILVKNDEYAYNSRGFNIVVIDKVSGTILDSAYFDTDIDVHLGVHESATTKFEKYWQYLKGVG